MKRVRVFMSVGAIGFVLQVGVLALLTIGAGWPYQIATAVAVELAVVHNFLWHERWTWRDQVGADRGLLARFLRYQITTGATSVTGNFLCTSVLVEQAGVPVLIANVAAVGMMAVANFMVSDRWVFTRGTMAAAALIAMASPASAAEPGPDTIGTWNTYKPENRSSRRERCGQARARTRQRHGSGARTATPDASSPDRSLAASSPAPGVSPWTQRVSTLNVNVAPLLATRVRSRTSLSARGTTTSASCRTASGCCRDRNEPSGS
jgi:putative flippase GtrA